MGWDTGPNAQEKLNWALVFFTLGILILEAM